MGTILSCRSHSLSVAWIRYLTREEMMDLSWRAENPKVSHKAARSRWNVTRQPHHSERAGKNKKVHVYIKKMEKGKAREDTFWKHFIFCPQTQVKQKCCVKITVWYKAPEKELKAVPRHLIYFQSYSECRHLIPNVNLQATLFIFRKTWRLM